MSFWTSVLHFLRQTRILNRINAFVERHNIPNLTFLFLVTAFPLFQLLKHSTLWLLPMCLFLLLQSLKSFLEEPKIDFADFLYQYPADVVKRERSTAVVMMVDIYLWDSSVCISLVTVDNFPYNARTPPILCSKKWQCKQTILKDNDGCVGICLS